MVVNLARTSITYRRSASRLLPLFTGILGHHLPDQPAALSSGWGTVFNYGLLSPGPHTLAIVDNSHRGVLPVLATHAVEVVRPGGFEYLDQFDLSGATARLEGDLILLSGVVVRDQASQQTKTVEVRLRWFESAQGLEIVAANNEP